MIIGNRDYDSIIVTNRDNENEVVAIISDTEVVEKKGFKVILEPTEGER